MPIRKWSRSVISTGWLRRWGWRESECVARSRYCFCDRRWCADILDGMVDMPKHHELHWPTVEALRELGGSGSISELDEQVVADQRFSDEQQAVLVGDGPGTMLANRLGWARTYLKGMGLAQNSARAVWSLTEAGRTVTEDQMAPLRKQYARRIGAARRIRAARRASVAENQDDDTDTDEESRWQDRLIEELLKMPPDAFERLCQRLLREAGFSRTQVTGRTGDGGMDGLGVYRLSLVSFQVFFQAKRWRNSVGAKEVRDFRGAMAGRGEKGLLITTSTFTADAKAEASRDGAPPVDLVDGAHLCELLAQYEIGVRVSQRTVRDIDIDADAIAAI